MVIMCVCVLPRVIDVMTPFGINLWKTNTMFCVSLFITNLLMNPVWYAWI